MKVDKYMGLPSAQDLNRYLVDGIRAVEGTSGHVQTNHGGGDNTRIRVNESAGHVRLPGYNGAEIGSLAEKVAAVDVDAVNEVIAVGVWHLYVDRIAYRHFTTGAVTYAFVKGTYKAAAADALAYAPSNDDIQAVVGAGNPWVRLYRLHIERTGDATVTCAYDNTARPLGVVRSGGARQTSEL